MSNATRETTLVRWLVGWLNRQPQTVAWKVHGSMYQPAGMPDVLCVTRGALLALEVKRPGERPRPLQQHRLAKLAAAGVVAAVITTRAEARDLFTQVTTGSQNG